MHNVRPANGVLLSGEPFGRMSGCRLSSDKNAAVRRRISWVEKRFDRINTSWWGNLDILKFSHCIP